MATSIQTCIPNSCKDQHQMKTMTRSPNFLRRSSMRQNTANRKSAVERLEESKANYVKSERVLDTKQEFKNSSHLRVSTGPQLDILFKMPAKPHEFKLGNTADDLNLACLRLHHQSNSKSPPTLRARAKSHSEFRETHITRKHSFASQCSRHKISMLVDIESQLKQLITSGSRENISSANESALFGSAHDEAHIVPKILKVSEVPKVRRGYSDPVRKSCWVPSDRLPNDINFSIHKSMPDLSPSPHNAHLSISSMSSDDSNIAMYPQQTNSARYYPIENHATAMNNVVIRQPENEDDAFDSYREPRRFSNGTGMLHLTPYYPSTGQLQRRPVSRSKSDVSHRYSKRCSDYFPRRNNNYTSAEIERFFDTMGLDTTVWHHITSPSLVSSPPCFFESISSVDSNEGRSSICSEDSIPDLPREGLKNHDLRGHGPLETSIVEKNARVIKWLYNCRKAACES